MSCKHLNCDIIIASEISDFVNFINDFARKDVRISLIKDHIFTIEDCIEKARDCRFHGMGNVFASEDALDYKRFLANCNVLRSMGNDFKVIESNIYQNPNGKIDKIKLIKNIFKCAYTDEVLKALDII